jgi:hypothetical protein
MGFAWVTSDEKMPGTDAPTPRRRHRGADTAAPTPRRRHGGTATLIPRPDGRGDLAAQLPTTTASRGNFVRSVIEPASTSIATRSSIRTPVWPSR